MRPQKRLLQSLILLLLCCLFLWPGIEAGSARGAPPRQTDLDHFVHLPLVHGAEADGAGDYAQQVVDLVNAHRANAGCPPLDIDPRLVAAAQGHSQDMATSDFFSHTGSDGSRPWDRMEAEGYNWSRAAENIAAGYPTPEDVVAAWMNSTGHRNNILNCALVDTGVGYVHLADDTGSVNYHHYWTHDFGAPR